MADREPGLALRPDLLWEQLDESLTSLFARTQETDIGWDAQIELSGICGEVRERFDRLRAQPPPADLALTTAYSDESERRQIASELRARWYELDEERRHGSVRDRRITAHDAYLMRRAAALLHPSPVQDDDPEAFHCNVSRDACSDTRCVDHYGPNQVPASPADRPSAREGLIARLEAWATERTNPVGTNGLLREAAAALRAEPPAPASATEQALRALSAEVEWRINSLEAAAEKFPDPEGTAFARAYAVLFCLRELHMKPLGLWRSPDAGDREGGAK